MAFRPPLFVCGHHHARDSCNGDSHKGLRVGHHGSNGRSLPEHLFRKNTILLEEMILPPSFRKAILLVKAEIVSWKRSSFEDIFSTRMMV